MFSKISAGGKLKDKKKLFTLLFAAVVVILFAVFLLSLSGEEKDQSAAASSQAQTAGELVINQDTVTEPASKRYDYNNVVTDESTDAEDASEVASSPFDILDQKASGNAASVDDGAVSSDSAETLTAVKPTVQAVLYCDSFADKSAAETQKAKIAFIGVISSVVQRDGAYKLKIGPFPSRDEAKQIFSKLGDNSLVGTCSLVDE